MKKYILLTLFSLNFIQVDCHSMDGKENLKVNISSIKQLIKIENDVWEFI
jgi:hypothetical protein